MARDIPALRTVADYQFGTGAGEALYPLAEAFDVSYSSGGRPRQIYGETTSRIASYGTDGRFTLGTEGGRRLVAAFPSPTARVVVGEESRPFVRDGRNAFAKFVRDVDPTTRPGDEVVVVDGADDVLGVGSAALSADGMADFDTGMAVRIREGADD